MKRVVRIALVASLSAAPAVAQETATPAPAPQAASPSVAPATQDGFVNFFRTTEVSGTADVYFTYSSNKPAAGSNIPLRVFDSQHNQFTLALAEVALSKPVNATDRVGFRFDLDFGPVADAVNAFEPGGATFRNIQQAYVSYYAPAGTGLTMDFGKFVTPLGAEVIEAKDNWNYSRSILFGYAVPFYHTGLRLGYAPTAKVSIGATLTNGWNNGTENNSAKTFGLSATFKPTGALAITENYMAGPEQNGNTDDWRQVWDTILSYTVNDKVSLLANYDYGKDTVDGETVSWQGVAFYVKAQVTPIVALVPRVEYYDDSHGGFSTGAPQTVKAVTFTAEVKHSQGLLTRFEYRGDWSDLSVFPKGDDVRKQQQTFTVAFVFAFSSK